MKYGYIVKISGQNFYTETQLGLSANSYSIGTKLESDLRFRKDLFFEEFELYFSNEEDKWSVTCSDNLFFDFGDIRKLATKQLEHGDVFFVKYQESENEILRIEFLFDFDNEKKDYTRVVDISKSERIVVGAASDANLQLSGKYLNQGCFELIKRAADEGYNLNIRMPGYGVYHNGAVSDDYSIIHDGDFVSIANYSLYLKSGCVYTSRAVKIRGLEYHDLNEHSEYPKFNRNTRLKSMINEEPITVLDPPKKPQKPSGNILMQLIPALAMIALTIVVRGFMGNSSNSSFIIFSICSMTIGIITSMVAMISERKKYKRSIAERIDKYNAYVDQKREQIALCRADELSSLNNLHIAPQEELENISNFSGDIFDKVVNDEDFLQIRLGLGTVNARRKISYKKQETFESEDELASLPEQISEEFKQIDNAPITLDIKTDNVIGVVGSSEQCRFFVKSVLLDIIARHYYKDVQIFFLIDSSEVGIYSDWLKWLPHILDERTNIKNIVYDTETRSSIFERLYMEFSKRISDKEINLPHYIIFVLNDWGIKTHPVAQFIPHAHNCNTSYFFFEREKEQLPLWCSKFIKLESPFSGTMVSVNDKDRAERFTYTEIKDMQLVEVAKKLSPVYCEEISLENALTRSITLFDLLNILGVDDINLKANWAKAEIYETMAAPLGIKTKDEIVYLDLHEKAHGPHGLVAGTTGSGKSEILQTYILSMATLFHPYEVGFVVIDFKGGGMVNQFKTLPHLIGAITNIDGKEINRSLMSIKAELEKRQRIFAENGVNSISNYIKRYKSGKASIPVPHLIIIVDEFAELKAEQPEFMKELISAARIGRSLGVHLILATQKPAGQVNEQIWSNSKFKLCLKVQTKEDSNEVLKSPLAAEIREPGRAYLQVGNNEIFELFQSAYSGAPACGEDAMAEKAFVISEVNLQGKRHIVFQKSPARQDNVVATQLDAIVEYIKNYCENEGIPRLSNICLAPLEDLIEYTNPGRSASNDLIIPMGIYDDPEHQAQEVATLNVASGNTVIIGSAQYGKTNLLQLALRSLSENYSPSELNAYILDFGSMALRTFEGFHHVGGVVTSSEDERVKNLFRLLSKEVTSRKERLAQLGITSFNSYVEAGYTDLPRVVLMIDNFIAFKELYPDYDDDLLTLCREGIALGISIIITSMQSNGISYKYISCFSNRICLFCNSGDEYNFLFDRCRMAPKPVAGRALIQIDKKVFEAQTYLAFVGEREIDRVESIQKHVRWINMQYSDTHAKEIPSIPKLLNNAYITKMTTDNKPYQLSIGMDYNTIEVKRIDLSRIMTLGISGREKGGKTNFVKLIFDYCLSSVFDHPTEAYIIDDYSRQLKQFSSYGFVERYTIDVNVLEDILSEIEEKLRKRKTMLQEKGPECLEREPLLICAIENQMIFDNDGVSKQVLETYKRIISSYKRLKVLFIFTSIPNVNITYSSSEMLKQIKDVNTLFIMDDLINTKIVDINASVLRQYKKPIELGDAYSILSDGTISKLKTIKSDERSENNGL